MPSQLSGESFIAVVQKSGLVDPDRLKRLIEERPPTATNADAIAEHLVNKGIVTRWQAEKLLLGKHKGFMLGKYRLLSLLGKGGMSSVYLAEHLLMKRRCAIKVLPTKRVNDSSYLARFHREAVAVAALDHPNIVRAYDVDHQTDSSGDIHFLVMEYVDGSSLQDLVAQEEPCAIFDAVDYVRQAAVGLAHAHKAGMVHRDIKPGNLLLDRHGTVKILDLGLARFFGGNEGDGDALTIQHDERVLGTADYLAPEQALDSHTVDARADIYSLGCTLYFLLTGHPPFTEGTLAQRLMAHQQKEPPAVEQDRPDTPESLALILRKMMAKKPDDRYATAAETAEVLGQWLSANASEEWRKTHAHGFARAPGDSQITRGGSSLTLKTKPGEMVGSTKISPRQKLPGSSAIKAAAQTTSLPAGNLVAKPVAKPVAAPVKPGDPKGSTKPVRPVAKVVAPAPTTPSAQQTPGITIPTGGFTPPPAASPALQPEFADFLSGLTQPAAPAASVAKAPPTDPVAPEPKSAEPIPEPEPPAVQAPAPVSAPAVAKGPDFSFLGAAAEQTVIESPPAFGNFQLSPPSPSPPAVEEPAAQASQAKEPEPPPAEPVKPEPAQPAQKPMPRFPRPAQAESKPAAPGLGFGLHDPADEQTVVDDPEAMPRLPARQTVQEFDPAALQFDEPPLNFEVDPEATLTESPMAAPMEEATATSLEGAVETPQPAFAQPASTAGGPTFTLPAFGGPTEPAAAAMPAFPSVSAPSAAPTAVALAPPPVAKPKAVKQVKSLNAQALLSPPRKKYVLIGGGGVVALAILVGAAFALGLVGSKPKTKDKVAESKPSPARKAVTKKSADAAAESAAAAAWETKRQATVGPTGDFKTIGEALQIVKQHFRPAARSDRFLIKVAAGRYAERIVIDASFPDNIVIQGTDGAVLEPSGSEPIIRAKDVQGLQVHNFALKAAGHPVAIELSDRLPRCQLQKLNVTDIVETGVSLLGTVSSSFSADRLTLRDVHLSGSGSAVGVAVSRGSDGIDSSNLLFEQCRFLGPLAAGITVSGADALNYEFRECVFAECQAGVKLLPKASWREFKFIQNTFYKCGYGVLVSEQPPTSQKGITFRRNLFVETSQTEVFIEKDYSNDTLIKHQMLGPIEQNWTDRTKAEPANLPPGELPMFYNSRAEPGLTFASTDRSDAKFLAPGPNSPQRTVGGQQTGEKPWIGAVGP